MVRVIDVGGQKGLADWKQTDLNSPDRRVQIEPSKDFYLLRGTNSHALAWGISQLRYGSPRVLVSSKGVLSCLASVPIPNQPVYPILPV